jgi:glycosyltransferase involved in cell wall biosynthesis
MVTLPVPERLESAQRAIADFCRQTLARKQLVIVANGGERSVRDALRAYVAELDRQDIQIVMPTGTLNLGQLRNISLEAANGQLICQWGDDARFHPERLVKQAAALLDNNLEAVYLQDVMHYFPDDRAIYWNNWRTTPTLGHPGTLMARRTAHLRYPIQGEVLKLGADRVLAEALMARGKVGFVSGAPHLHVCVSYSAGTQRYELAVAQAELERREAHIRTELELYEFPPGTAVCGSDGAAFRL